MSPEQKNILAATGVALLALQTTERIIRFCMTFVLPKTSSLTLEALESQEKAERKRTLGYFLSELRKRVDLARDFEAVLEEFLERRNALVHRIDDIPGWNLASEDGHVAAKAFINRLLTLNEHVLKVFVGLARAWQKQIDLKDDVSEGQAIFTEIDEQVLPLIDDIFRLKGT